MMIKPHKAKEIISLHWLAGVSLDDLFTRKPFSDQSLLIITHIYAENEERLKDAKAKASKRQ